MFVPQEQRQDGPNIKVGAIEATLNDAESLLRQIGWVNGNPRRLGGSATCIAFALATFNQKIEYFRTHDVMLRAAQIQTGRSWRDIPEYNDAHGRTIEDVWDLFKIARELLQAR